jgi:ribosomal protein S18 acetylase RimI-like enzyme
VQLTPRRYDHPDAQLLIAAVQQEYVQRYGSEDDSPVDPDEFAEPSGLFVVGYQDDEPVVMGGWRRHGDDHPETRWAGNAAEIKRMYVVPAARGRAYARGVLCHLEQTAHAAGIDWLLLETGLRQPEAIALYRACGYQDVPSFGHYAGTPEAVHLGKQLSDEPALSGWPGVPRHYG